MSTKGHKTSDETKRKLSDIMKVVMKGKSTSPKTQFKRGCLHPNWKGGHSGERILACAKKEYKQWRMRVFNRDDFTCILCGEVGGNLNAHHIRSWKRYPKLRLILENGITLCVECHRLLHKILK